METRPRLNSGLVSTVFFPDIRGLMKLTLLEEAAAVFPGNIIWGEDLRAVEI